MKKQISTTNAPSAPILSQAIEAGGLIFVAGQVNADNEWKLVGNSVEEKVAQIMKNIEAILKAADANLNDIVKVVIYVTDMAQMPELNRVYTTYFKEPMPTREAVSVKELPLGATIELSVIAVKADI